MPSFDIVCEVNMQEVDNAVNQASRDIATRFDFKGGQSRIDLDKGKSQIRIIADDEMKLRSIHQIIESRMAKRKVDCRLLRYGQEEEAGGRIIRQEVSLKSGIEKEEAKKIIRLIKETKLKVQAQIQEDQIRVSGKKIDELQLVISSLNDSGTDLPLQYINMRG